jgi:hypothetical protein
VLCFIGVIGSAGGAPTRIGCAELAT